MRAPAARSPRRAGSSRPEDCTERALDPRRSRADRRAPREHDRRHARGAAQRVVQLATELRRARPPRSQQLGPAVLVVRELGRVLEVPAEPRAPSASEIARRPASSSVSQAGARIARRRRRRARPRPRRGSGWPAPRRCRRPPRPSLLRWRAAARCLALRSRRDSVPAPSSAAAPAGTVLAALG